MSLLTTISGKGIDFRNLASSPMCIRDIAYSLSNINRFNGHAMRNISMAEHSLMVCEIMQRHYGQRSPAVLMAALLRDAHKALIGDVTQPVQEMLGGVWDALEEQVRRVVLKHYGVWTAYVGHSNTIRSAALHARSTQGEQLMHSDTYWWECRSTHPALDWLRLGASSHFTPDDWRQAFLDRYQALASAITQQQAAIDGTTSES